MRKRDLRRAAATAGIALAVLAGCGGNPALVTPDGAAVQPVSQQESLPQAPDVSDVLVVAKEAELSASAGDPQRGREIFESGGEKYTEQFYCSRCHSLDGTGGYGPTMQGIAVLAGERVPGMTAEAYIRQSILDPDAFIVEGYLQNMGLLHSRLLSQQEVEDLVAFLLTQ